MADTLWVDVSGRAKGDLPRDNSIILRLLGRLDGIASKLRVPKLREFIDYSVAAAAYSDSDDDEDEGTADEATARDEGSCGAWYDPGPALVAVRAIHAHLTKHPEDIGANFDPSHAHWPDALMDELSDCLSELEAAVAQGRQFRFLLVP